MSRRPQPLTERFWAKVDKSGDCWMWTASKSRRGYGQIGVFRKVLLAHRVSYELAYGAIPEGLVIDHACRVKACVNPSHLRAITQKQNTENRSGAHGATGALGVYPVTDSSTFQAIVTHEGKRHYLGTFATKQEAAEAARQKRLSLFQFNDLDRRSA